YQTYKVVKLKDKSLGLLYYGCLAVIIAYISFSVLTQKLYLKKSPPIAGSVRASVQLDSNPASPPPAYCSVPPAGTNSTFGNCLFWSGEQIAYPFEGELNTLFITTRVSISQTPPPPPGCGGFWSRATAPDGTRCTPPGEHQTTNKTIYYIANIENITLVVDHTVRVSYPNFLGMDTFESYEHLDMKGKMLKGCVGSERNVSKAWDMEYRRNGAPGTNPPVHMDMFSLTDLLDAASCDQSGKALDLDANSTADGARSGETWRSSGMVIS
ncbi:cytochrome c oxidase subunit 1, partial [Borealophlyctis nickersoniae]